jgi:hypothetical protein
LKEWTPGCGLLFRYVFLDEFASIATEVEEIFIDLAESVLSVGILLIPMFQRATGDRFPTSARAMFGAQICFGVKTPTDASMALSDEVLEAGAAPWIWQNRCAGYHYNDSPGVEDHERSEPCRTFKPNEKLMREWAEYFIARRAASGSASTLGPSNGALEPRPEPAPAARRHSSVEPAVEDVELVGDDQGPRPYDPAEPDEIEVGDIPDDELESMTEEAFTEAMEGVSADELERERPHVDMPADLAAELERTDNVRPLPEYPTEAPRMPLGLGPEMSPLDAQRYLRDHLIRLGRQGVEQLKVEELDDVLLETGMRASWLSKWLGHFSEDHPVHGPAVLQKLTAQRGFYRIALPPELR